MGSPSRSPTQLQIGPRVPFDYADESSKSGISAQPPLLILPAFLRDGHTLHPVNVPRQPRENQCRFSNDGGSRTVLMPGDTSHPETADFSPTAQAQAGSGGAPTPSDLTPRKRRKRRDCRRKDTAIDFARMRNSKKMKVAPLDWSVPIASASSCPTSPATLRSIIQDSMKSTM